MKKLLISVGLVVCLVMAFALPACVPKAAPPVEEVGPYEKYVASLPEGCFPVPRDCFEQAIEEGALNEYNWAEWWPEEIYSGFSEEFGIKVTNDYYASIDEVVAKFKLNPETPYDIVYGAGIGNFKRLQALGAVREINADWIPNVRKYIPEEFIEMDYDPGWRYSVSSDMYFTGYGYNTKYVDDPRIPSFAVLFEPDEKYKGRITLLDDMFEVIGAALIYLGYSWNSEDEEELMEAKDLLLRLKPDLMAFESSPKRLLSEEEAWISQQWYGDLWAQHRDDEYIVGVLPAEGTLMGVSTTFIPVGSPHPAAAHLFINYFFRPDVNAVLLEAIVGSPMHTGAIELLPEEMLEWAAPPEGYIELCEIGDPRVYTGKGLELRTAIWEEVKR